jgi:F-type H+-transporting ATPase subunit b
LIVPSTIVIPREGSFALAFLGRVRRVHDPIFSVALGRCNLALKRIVALVSCTLASFINCYATSNGWISHILTSRKNPPRGVDANASGCDNRGLYLGVEKAPRRCVRAARELPGRASSGEKPRPTCLHTMEIARQLGELFLEAVPTIVIVFLFYFFLRYNFFGPIEHAMAERGRRIEGARAEAAAAQAAAKQEMGSYEDALRKARAGLYAQQEAERQAVLDERAKLLQATRVEAQQVIHAAKEKIAAEAAAARAELEKQGLALGTEIARAILERPGGPRAGAR